MKYPKYLLTLIIFALGGTLTAQETKFNRFSLELTTGIDAPLSLRNGKSTSDYIAFKQFQISGRYMISQTYGIKGFYGYNQFNPSNDSNNGLTFHRVGAEAVVNINRLLNINSAGRRQFNVLAHGGMGLSLAKPDTQSNTDNIGNVLMGMTGEIKLSNRFSILGDVTYLANLRQHTYFDGTSLPHNDYKTGSFVNISVGIMYSLGPNKFHADWY
ncbi:hypothetical protein [Aequorivita ciconiae]|nr:hypothetical protein [Aequorivita sp. H23M31]